MRNTLETRLGLFFALTLVATLVIMEMIGGARFTRGMVLRARFHDVREIKVGDAVKMAGYRIGRVERIDLAEDQVQVTLRVDINAAVRTSSIATIKFIGLMGQNYVSIGFG